MLKSECHLGRLVLTHQQSVAIKKVSFPFILSESPLDIATITVHLMAPGS